MVYTQAVRRGDIYYINNDRGQIGSEMKKDRPAVVVSNDMNNRYSNEITVVFLTSKPKKNLETHVTVYSTGRESVALCEGLTTLDKQRAGKFLGRMSRNMNSIAFKERFEEGFRRLLVPVLKENGDREATLDTFFLLSVEEMKDEEKKYQRFRSERDCVKVNPEQETECHWTRSAHRGNASLTWFVYASGGVGNNGAVYSSRFAPACVIGAKAIK